MKTLSFLSIFALSLILVMGGGNPSHAQAQSNLIQPMYSIIQLKEPEVQPDQIPSVFLTSIEENLVITARKGLETRMPTEAEFSREQSEAEKAMEREVFRSAPREVSLGGVLYSAPDDWTVWINSQKISPKNLPSEILDIEVNNDHIKLKWFDVQTNQVFPIKLRTHQRFNLDTRIFLPG